MKYKYRSRFVAIVVMVSMFLSCIFVPATATAAITNESLNSAVEVK